MVAPSFLDLAEEAPAALGSEDLGRYSSATFPFPIKALSVHQGLDVLVARSQGPSIAPVGLPGP